MSKATSQCDAAWVRGGRRSLRSWLSGALASFSLLLACGGCQERGLDQVAETPQASLPLSEPSDGGAERIASGREERHLVIITHTHLLPLAGKIDTANRYRSAVRIRVDFPEQQELEVCGGVIVSRHLVLTAGHCLCRQRIVETGPGTVAALMDGSTCAKEVVIKMLIYEPREGVEDDTAGHFMYQLGTVRLHPEFQVRLDAQGQVESSAWDVALIQLEKPVSQQFQPLPLADEEVQLNEMVTIVGSAYDEVARYYDGERHYSRNKVTRVLPSGGGRMRIEQPGGHHYRGESGGPCLRETAKGLEIVGISARNLGEGEAVTSTYGFRDWVRAEIQRVEKRKPSPRSP